MKHKKNSLAREAKRERKAQIKMGETIAILFVFFFILVIGAVFYVRLQASSTQQSLTETFERRAVSLSQVISFLPETQCTEANVVKPSCFDLYKVEALAELSDSAEYKQFYIRELGISKIEIDQIYPAGQRWTIFNNTPDFFIEAPITRFPITLYDAPDEKYYFGILEVTVYRSAEAPPEE